MPVTEAAAAACRDEKHFSTEDDLDTLIDSQERLEVLQELYGLILDYYKCVRQS